MKKIVLSPNKVRRTATLIILLGVGLIYAPLLIQVVKPTLLRTTAAIQSKFMVKAYDYYFGDEDYTYDDYEYEDNFYAEDCSHGCYDGYAEDYFDYPELGINAPVSFDYNTDPFDYNDWYDIRDSLRRGVSLSYDGDYQDFDELRDFYVIGHSSEFNLFNPYAFTFAGLRQGRPDDTFVVHTEGKKYTYRVTGQEILDPYYDKERFADLRNHDDSIQRAMIVTCYPAFSTSKRLVLIGERSL